ncbi:conserved hypothetical protein [[Clostridium] ultunense Esp]|uniref:DUF2935 domain-containing protein n=1 Tax=[Clostridium] ultunense Esp TaxID=1288971 RepID=M1Z9F9_9FIRM|nr:DUF2935 domain-containing protein [Schnuerera ultunensis]CCQ94238.1 conserved hypothetical protein [[Clostridium] ultunense Esp]SHD76808.1 conserved protein of unknown function [[Clostridium] ultunense Esp]
MLSRRDYIKTSLELNLFFGRIMKEHMIFMEVGLLIIDSSLILEGDQLKRSFEEILLETIALSKGAINQEVLESEELVTPLTLNSETITQDNTGICINKEITLEELELESNPYFDFTSELERRIDNINKRAINLVIEVIKFKEKVLAKLLECKMFANLYQLLIDHILREAKFYLMALENVQKQTKPITDILEQEIFWDTIMKEHAFFIRGLLDPTEVDLFNTANDFSQRFDELIERTEEANKEDIPKITKEAIKLTTEIRDFKVTGTEGLIDCQIKAMAYPLLGDHILREANRYIRLLKSYLKGH